MGSEKRERQKENRRHRLEEEAQAWRHHKRRRQLIGFGAIALVVLGVIAVMNLFGDDGSDEVLTAEGTAPTTVTDQSLPTPVTAPPPGETITGETPCPAADGSSLRTTSFENPPPMCIDATKQYTAVVSTDIGDFTIDLDAESAPVTTNNFVVLSRYHYFDGVGFHRVIPGFVIQGGDAVGTPSGTGNPGYSIEDELPDSVDAYVRGSVAMANSGPDTGGSQWFIWMGPNALPGPDFSLFGQVTDGLDTVVPEIEAGGSDVGDPVQAVTINTITIEEA